jgi:uncharacterized protein DUF6049
VHGLLPAELKRRILSLAAIVAVPAAIVTAGLAQAAPAQAGPAERAATGRVWVTIDSINPLYAKPGATVTVSGTVTNGTRQTQAGLEVQLNTSATHFTTRIGMNDFLSRGLATGLVPAGNPDLLPASLGPGASASWSASFQVSASGISSFGVYPVTAQLQDLSGGLSASDQTLLPFWPGSPRTAGLAQRMKISWLWPLIDQPQHQACAALASNDLAAAVKPGGRLSALVNAGASHPDAHPAWAIDPALLADISTMTRQYQVGGKTNCTEGTSRPASAAASSWLALLRQATRGQPTVITPYANVDMTALVHQGLTKDLAAAYRTGDAVASSVLHAQVPHGIAWPPGGTADLSTLTRLATAENIGTVVLNSSEMPPLDGATVFRPDDAVASLRVAGLPMNVLLSDNTLTEVLTAGNASSGALPRSNEFAVRQRFLAETAMIAAEFPDSVRSIVVAPPDEWSPSEALAGDLLTETALAPWLAPTPLASLSSAPDTQRSVKRQPPPASKASPGELSRGYLAHVRDIGNRLAVYQSMLYKPGLAYTRALDEALLATESAAWRPGGTARGTALADALSGYIRGAENKVRIISSNQVPMGGSSGQIPVSIQNGLHQAIRVRIVTSVENTPDRTSQLTVGRVPDAVVIQPQQPATVRLQVSSAPQGSTVIQLSLTSADGTPLPWAGTSLTVVSTRYGRAILFLIGAAIGVLVLTSAYRGVRRWLRDDSRLVNEEAGPPGSVVDGTSDARHPTEAPDDLADARRWVDDA